MCVSLISIFKGRAGFPQRALTKLMSVYFSLFSKSNNYFSEFFLRFIKLKCPRLMWHPFFTGENKTRLSPRNIGRSMLNQ